MFLVIFHPKLQFYINSTKTFYIKIKWSIHANILLHGSNDACKIYYSINHRF
jgi:hypothetical protein